MFFRHLIKSIKPTDRVLEIGPGSTPHPRSDVFLELDLSKKELKKQSGSNEELQTNKKVVFYDGNSFPFNDKEFDYVICSHVIEHVDNVKYFLNEMFRVASMGYIEYPTIIYEYLYNFNVHKNFVKTQNHNIFFIKKNRTHLNDFYGVQSLLYDSLSKGYTSIIDEMQSIMFEGFEWNKPFKVIETNNINLMIPNNIIHPKESKSDIKLSLIHYIFKNIKAMFPSLL